MSGGPPELLSVTASDHHPHNRRRRPYAQKSNRFNLARSGWIDLLGAVFSGGLSSPVEAADLLSCTPLILCLGRTWAGKEAVRRQGRHPSSQCCIISLAELSLLESTFVSLYNSYRQLQVCAGRHSRTEWPMLLSGALGLTPPQPALLNSELDAVSRIQDDASGS
jgi:hypothetical protein